MKSGVIIFIVILVTLAGAAGMVIFGYKPAILKIEDEGIRITGIYGLHMEFKDITSVEVADVIPRVKMRTNGYSFGGTNKGYFTVEEWGRTRLFTHVRYKGPYLIITDRDGMRTVYRTFDNEQANMVLDNIRSRRQ
ncbi:MAG: hypothetical protein LUE26_05175 [Alistipes sp.]|nr:hypothetical protein [Alistipes sp.]